jgi:adenosyl cobinamide kinase/adenosyl cobinamide phosphate guanylyltransferase
MTINNMPVMRMTFEFRDAAGRAHFTETKTHKAYSVTDEPDELLIYDPRNPEKAVLVDTLPGFVRHIVEEMEATQRGRRNRGRY